MRKRKIIATQCDCCGSNIFYGDTCTVFLHSIAQYEGPEAGFRIDSLIAGDVVKHLCATCSKQITGIDDVRKELAGALGMTLRQESDPLDDICEQCGTELRPGHSRLLLEKMSARIDVGEDRKDKYVPICDDGLLELCAACGTRIGKEEARAAFHAMFAAIAQGACTVASNLDEDLFLNKNIVREHTAPVDPEKLAEAGIVTREHLKGRFFRVDIDYGSSGIWETDRPCLVGGMGCNLDYDEFELPEWLLQRFLFWEHWHNQFSPMDNLPIDFDWESFSAYGRSLAVDLKYHLGPNISVCYRDKEVTLGPLFRDPMPKERKEPVLV